MAKRKVNKSKEVREYLAKHPDAMPAEVARALKRFGITAQFVSNVKTKMNSVRAKPDSAVENEIIAAAELIRICGDSKKALESIRIAERVASLMRK